MPANIFKNVKKNIFISIVTCLLSFHALANDYTFTFSGKLTQVIDNNAKLTGTNIAIGAPFTGYFTYNTAAAPWFVPPWTGNFTYEWVKAYRFTVHTTQGDYEFGYVDSSRAFYQVDVRNYDKLWWGQAYIRNVVTNFPSQRGDYSVGFNLSNTAGTLWSTAALPTSLRASDFDFTEVSFGGYDNAGQNDYRIVGTLDPELVVPTSHVPGLSPLNLSILFLLMLTLGGFAVYHNKRKSLVKV